MQCLALACNNSQDLRLLKNILEAIAEFLTLDALMGWTKTESAVAYHFERAGGLDAIEDVQKSSNMEIYHMAVELVKTYFDIDENGTDSA